MSSHCNTPILLKAGDNSGTTLDKVPLEGISSTKIQMGIKPHLNQVSLDIVKKLVDESQPAFLFIWNLREN
jgi:hypothetical protein